MESKKGKSPRFIVYAVMIAAALAASALVVPRLAPGWPASGDETPPATEVEVLSPSLGRFITDETPIVLNAVDGGSPPAGIAFTYYRILHDWESDPAGPGPRIYFDGRRYWYIYFNAEDPAEETGPFTMGELGVEHDGPHDIQFYSVDAAGNEEKWSHGTVMGEPGHREAFSSLAIDRSGVGLHHIAYTTAPSSGGQMTLAYRFSEDGGDTWSDEIILGGWFEAIGKPDIATATDGDIHIVFSGRPIGASLGIYHCHYDFAANDDSYDGLGDPAGWSVYAVDESGRDNVYPRIAVDSDSKASCVWIGDGDGLPGGGQDIFFSSFDAEDLVWRGKEVLHEGATDEPGRPGPVIVADSDDDLHVVFLDSFSGSMKYLMYNGSKEQWGAFLDGKWKKERTDDVGESSASYGTVAGLGIENEVLHVVWQDVRGGTGLLYENTLDLVGKEGFAEEEWPVTSGDSIDDDGTTVGEVLLEDGTFENLHLPFRDSIGYDLWHMEYDGEWSAPEVAVFSGAETDLSPDLAVNGYDNPCVTYTTSIDPSLDSDVAFVPKYPEETYCEDDTPPCSRKVIGEPSFGENGEWISPSTLLEVTPVDYCTCKKVAIHIKGPKTPGGKSAKNMENFLKRIGYDVKLPGSRKGFPTKSELLDALNPANIPKPCCILVIYYSGHSGQQKDDNNDEADGKDERMVLRGKERMTDDELAKAIAKIKCANIVVILETCHAGGYIKDIERESGKAKQKVEVFASCEEARKSFGGQEGRGHYTHFLIQGFQRAQCVSIQKAHEHAKKMIKKKVKKPQKPQDGGVNQIVPKKLECAGSGGGSSGYRIDGGSETVVPAGTPVIIQLTDEGPHTLEYWGVDALENEEEHNEQVHNVDATPPVPVVVLAPPVYEGVPLLLSAAGSYDPSPGSGIGAYAWDLDGDGLFGDGEDEDCDGVTVEKVWPEPGLYTVGLRVTDNVENMGEVYFAVEVLESQDEGGD